MLTLPRDSRGYWWAGLVLFLLAAAFLGLTAIMLFTEAYALGAGPDGSNVDCRAMSVAIVWGDGIEQAIIALTLAIVYLPRLCRRR